MLVRRLLVLSAVSSLALGPPPVGASADTQDFRDSLPSVGTGAPPGPDVLYAPRPAAPQLANHDPRFTARPLLVSGTEGYVDGEYLYQDFLHDDFGADTDGNDGAALAPSAGDLTYPQDRERYAGNAADLAELRVAPGASEVAYRITLGALPQPDATIVAVAVDTDGDESTGTGTLPGGPGAPFPGTDEAITVWGTGGEHVAFDAGGDETATTDLEVAADTTAAQITVTVPRTVSDPRGTWRVTVATGIHDDQGGWRLPQESADEQHPGGASSLPGDTPGIFNLAFRFGEPIAEEGVPPDTAQAAALADGEPTRFAHELDFDRLDAGETDLSGVPTIGTMVRLFPSRLDLGEGRNLGTFPALEGQLQPYSVHVPEDYDPADPPGLTLNMHSLSSHHWQYNGSVGVRQLGEERSHVVATPHARGDDGWYQHEAEYDVFEVWNDLAHHYRLDPDRTSSAGYSMGGYATYRLATRYPDLFGTAMTVVGPPGDGIWAPPNDPTGGAATLSNRWLENARNVPYLNIAAGGDELVPIAGPTAQNIGVGALADGFLDVDGGLGRVDEGAGIQSFEALGYRYRFRVYPAAEHFTLALADYEIPGSVAFLGDGDVDRDPAHVTFAAVPDADDPELGLVADGAYWVSDVTLADEAAGKVPKGVVDVFSHGFGLGHPETERHADAGVGPLVLAYDEIGLDWAAPPETEAANLLEVELTNAAGATIDLARARLDPGQELTVEITAGNAGELVLDGAFHERTKVRRDGEVLEAATADRDGAVIPVVAGEQTVVLARPASAPDDPPAGEPGPPADPAADDQRPVLPATGAGPGLAALAMLGAAVLLSRDVPGRADRGRWRRRSGRSRGTTAPRR